MRRSDHISLRIITSNVAPNSREAVNCALNQNLRFVNCSLIPGSTVRPRGAKDIDRGLAELRDLSRRWFNLDHTDFSGPKRLREDYSAAALPCWPDAGRSGASARHLWIAAITCAPSPTAAATRLTEFERTSPTAKTPRRLVSSGRRSSPMSSPVSTKPRGSSFSPEAASQSVLGSAPMKENRW